MKKKGTGKKRLEAAIHLSKIAHEEALIEIKRQYPCVKKEDLSKLFLGWIAHEKYATSFSKNKIF